MSVKRLRPITITESDGTPYSDISSLVFPNGSVSVTGSAATIASAPALATVTTEASGDVTLNNSGGAWVDILSLILPAGTWNVRGYAHYNMGSGITATWIKLRLLDGGSVVLAAASVYLNNPATDDNLTCEDANVSGGQTVKLQGWTDASSGTNKVTKYDDWGDTNEIHTRLIGSPAAAGEPELLVAARLYTYTNFR